MRISQLFIVLGLTCLLVGMSFGFWMAANENFEFADAHAHWNLLGFVTSTLYGLVHRAYPRLAESKLAWPQFALHAVGALSTGPGVIMAIATGHSNLAMISGAMVFLAALTFLWMFISQKTEAA
jgi:hypothetical protein